jgi:hypothetical protein
MGEILEIHIIVQFRNWLLICPLILRKMKPVVSKIIIHSCPHLTSLTLHEVQTATVVFYQNPFVFQLQNFLCTVYKAMKIDNTSYYY